MAKRARRQPSPPGTGCFSIILGIPLILCLFWFVGTRLQPNITQPEKAFELPEVAVEFAMPNIGDLDMGQFSPKATQGESSAPACQNTACSDLKAYAKQLLVSRGVTSPSEFGCLDSMWGNESAWEPGRLNPSSQAVGIPQALPGEKIYGPGFRSMPRVQRGGGLYLRDPDGHKEVAWGVDYVLGRYQSPCKALAWWQRTDCRGGTGLNRCFGGHWY